MHDFIIGPTDTDSISFGRRDGSAFSQDEQISLLNELRSISPEMMVWEDDGYYPTIIALKSKNYVLWDGKKKIIKGSGLKDQKQPIAIKEFKNRLIDMIIEGRENYIDLYNEYIKEAMDIKDINRWASKKTISSKVFTSERSNESKVRDAIEGEDIVEGDRVYVFFLEDESLSLVESFNGEYNKERMLVKMYKAALIFANIIPKKTFINYTLKRNRKTLESLITNESY